MTDPKQTLAFHDHPCAPYTRQPHWHLVCDSCTFQRIEYGENAPELLAALTQEHNWHHTLREKRTSGRDGWD